MGSIHAIREGVRLLRLGGVGWLVFIFLPMPHRQGVPIVSPLLVELALTVLLAVAGWRILGSSPRERQPFLRRLLATMWFSVILWSDVVAVALWPPMWFAAAGVGLLAVVGTAAHVASHTRSDTALGRRIRLDAGAVAVLATMSLGLLVALSPGETMPVEGWWWVPFVGGALLCVRLLYRSMWWPEQLDPGLLPSLWRHRAAEVLPGAVIREDQSQWSMTFRVGDRTATLRVCRDPIPPWTELTLPVPELDGVTARRRHEGERAGLPLGNAIADSQLVVEGDSEGARIIADLDGPWMELLHGWRGTVRDGVFTAVFEGDVPRSEWVGGPSSSGTWDDAVIDRLVEGCRRAVASVTSDRERAGVAVPTAQRRPHATAGFEGP